jgi:hypothetical protein
MAKKNDLESLFNLISQARTLLMTTNLPEGRSQRANELLTASLHLVEDMYKQSPAAMLGAKGGKQTAKRGSEYFRKIAAMRKERKGGRPKADRPN